MKFNCLLMFALFNDKIIKNINLPSCKNCIYYRPSYSVSDYTSSLNKCGKFGEKNIITDEIKYVYADYCRSDESKCGKDGFYFEEDKNINKKILIHKIIYNLPYGIPFFILIANIIKILK